MVKAWLGKTLAAMLVLSSVGIVTAGGAKADDTVTSTTLRPAVPPQIVAMTPSKVKKNWMLAYQLAHYEWLDKVAAADPGIVAAICSHPGPARILASHRHIAEIADADHYLCRRLCRWRRATDALVRNPYADHVIALDPQGFIMAMDRDPSYAQVIAGHQQFNELINSDPELGKQIASHMR